VSGEPLPGELSDLVARVARRTRLRRRERAEIAAELEAHFRDGLAAGKSAGELQAAFGDEKVAARELRSGAMRKRSPLDRALRRTRQVISWTLVGGVAIWLLAAWRLWTLEPVVSVDFVAKYRESLPVAARDDERAWPAYREALFWWLGKGEVPARYRPLPRGESDELFVAITEEEPANELERAEHAARRARAEATLRDRRSEIALLREAAARPVFGRRPDAPGTARETEDVAFFGEPTPEKAPDEPWLGGMMSVLLPELVGIRHAGVLLVADAKLAESEGDFARAAADLAAVLGIARHASEGGTLINQLVAAAQRTRFARETVALLERSGERMPADALRRLADAIAAVPPSAFRADLAVERMFFEDLIQRSFSDDGNGDGTLLYRAEWELGPLMNAVEPTSAESALFAMLSPAAWLSAPRRAETLEQHQRWIEAFDAESARPGWDRGTIDARFEVEVRQGPSANAFLALMMPAIWGVKEVLREVKTDVDAAAIATALARFRVERGVWPTSLEELVPTYLATLPIDRETDLPLRYAVTDAGPKVWSTGVDGIDDGGVGFVPLGSFDGELKVDRVPERPRSFQASVRTAILRFRERTGRWPASLDELNDADRAGVNLFDRSTYALVDGVSVVRRDPPCAPGDAEALFRWCIEHTRAADRAVAQGDRVLVEWGCGSHEPRAATSE
jgi:hypothetical protein